jgi:hypothetical protein
VQRIPQRVERGNLVGEEFTDRHDARSREHPCVLQHEQGFRQVQVAVAAEQADDEDRRVQAEPAGPGQASGERELRQRIHQAAERSSAATGRDRPTSGHPRWAPFLLA